MAKTIKYQIATEIPRTVVVYVPLLDDEGNPVTKDVIAPVTEDVAVPVLAPDGAPLLDESGEPITETVTRPVYDEHGEPVVEITYGPVLVEETKQEIETILADAVIFCETQATLDANLPIVQREAYNGEYTVEGEFTPDPAAEEITATDMAAAILEGVDSV